MSNTKKVTINLTPEQQEKARFLFKDLFGAILASLNYNEL